MKSIDQYSPLVPGSARKRSGIGVLLDFIMLIITIIAAGMLVCAFLAKNIHPQNSWVFAFAGLSAPVLYVANILLLLFWAMRWKWCIMIPALTLLIGLGNLSLFFKPSFSKNYYTKESGSTVVMTYNVMGFLHDNEQGKKVSSIDSLTTFMNRYNPDILCMQEFQAWSESSKNKIDEILDMKYNSVHYPITNGKGAGWGLAVYSNFPIIAQGYMDFPQSTNSVMWADIVVRKDTVRVFNCHLQTTSVDTADREYISNQEFMHDSESREEKVRGIAAKLKKNYMKRAEQADSLAPVIHASPYNVFVCGDFNDTPMSYVYSKLKGKLNDAFVTKGKGLSSHTFRGLFNLFRIDYIFYSNKIKALNYSTPESEYSDHKAVVAGFLIP